MPDLESVRGFLTDDELEAAKIAFIDDFMARDAFATKYNSLDNTAYVDTLLQTAGVMLSNRQALIDSLNAGTQSQAQCCARSPRAVRSIRSTTTKHLW